MVTGSLQKVDGRWRGAVSVTKPGARGQVSTLAPPARHARWGWLALGRSRVGHGASVFHRNKVFLVREAGLVNQSSISFAIPGNLKL